MRAALGDLPSMEFRATIRRGRVTLVSGDHPLVEGGALAVLMRAALPAEVSLANVSFDEDEDADEREVHVEFLANDSAAARRALKRWANATGHHRVWFADEVSSRTSCLPRDRKPRRVAAAADSRCATAAMGSGTWSSTAGSLLRTASPVEPPSRNGWSRGYRLRAAGSARSGFAPFGSWRRADLETMPPISHDYGYAIDRSTWFRQAFETIRTLTEKRELLLCSEQICDETDYAD